MFPSPFWTKNYGNITLYNLLSQSMSKFAYLKEYDPKAYFAFRIFHINMILAILVPC